MTATVTDLDAHRGRTVPAWNPNTRRHAWQDIDVDGHHHKCVHCWVAYHSEPDGVGYVKVWSHGYRSGRSQSLGRCPGPDGRPHLELVPAPVDVSTPVLVAADQVAAPSKPAAVVLCCRCNPACGRPGRLHLGGYSCEQVVAAAGAATREWIDDMRLSGGAA